MPRYLVIGGVAGGATAAARLRRLDECAEIIIFERGGYVSYANCGLPYYIGGVIPDRNSLFVQTPQGFRNRFGIDVRVNTEVRAIDRDGSSVEAKDLATGKTFRERYDRLVLSPGAEPVRPPIPGIDGDGIFTLRSVNDTDRIWKHVHENSPKSVAVVGGGFIGIEMAENLHALGMAVTVIEMADQVMANLDYEMAAIVHHHLRAKCVNLLLKDGVRSFEKKGGGIVTRLTSGKEVYSGMVILSIGVRPDTSLAKAAGIALGPRGGIAVNEFLQTSDPAIYAVGDAIEFPNPVTRGPSIAFLAGPANKQGRIAADNIVLGNVKKYEGSIATAVAKVFDLTVASTGASGKLLAANGIPHLVSITHGASHATYYPGALQMSVKLLFSPEGGAILGAQVVGYDGVDKRIDVLAAHIGMKGTVSDLTRFEQAYAPPYSSAKDPVNMAGFVAENILNGTVKVLQWHDIPKLDPSRTFLLDVRTYEEHRSGTIPGSVNIPMDDLRGSLASIPKGKTIVIFCAVGLRGYVAARILAQSGYDVYNLSGGYATYSAELQDAAAPQAGCG